MSLTNRIAKLEADEHRHRMDCDCTAPMVRYRWPGPAPVVTPCRQCGRSPLVVAEVLVTSREQLAELEDLR